MKVLILNGPDDPAEKDTFLVRVDRWPGRKMRKFAKDETIQVYPIWLAYSAAVLKQEGFETFLIDAMVEQLTLENTMKKVKEINPEMIVLQVSTPSIEYDLKIAQQIKETIDTAIVIVQTSCFCPHFSGRFRGNHNGIERLTHWVPIGYAAQGCCSVSNFRGTAQAGSVQGVALPPY